MALQCSSKFGFFIFTALALYVLLTYFTSVEVGILHSFAGAEEKNETAWRKKEVSESSASTQDERISKPVFVLHVGPPKTATTFLQDVLCGDPGLTEPVLLKDNMVYLGTCAQERSQFFLHQPDAFSGFPDDADARLAVVLDRLSSQGLGGIIVYEMLSMMDDDKVQAYADFLNERFNVKVLIGHRSLYEWLPSVYNTQTKTAQIFQRWPGQIVSEMEMWDTVSQIGDVSMPYIPFNPDDTETPVMKSISGVLESIKSRRLHPAEMTRQQFAQFFEDVRIIPMEHLPTPPAPRNGTVVGKVDPLLNYIFCDMLHMDNTCELIRQGRLNAPPSNPSVSYNYDMLAVAAYQAGLLNGQTIGRTAAAVRVRNRQERTMNGTSIDFPLECLPDSTLSRFEELSLTLDRNLYKDEWSFELEENHHRGFLRSHRKTYCWVNTTKVLEDRRWQIFFKRSF